MGLVVEARLHHPEMTADRVECALRQRLPALASGGLDLLLRGDKFEAEFFRQTVSSLDLTVRVLGSLPVHSQLSLLLERATLVQTECALALADGSSGDVMTYGAMLVDERSRHEILKWKSVESPLRSVGARAAYLVSGALLLAAAGLTIWQIRDGGQSTWINVTTILLATIIPALLSPLPYVVEHMQNTKQLGGRVARGYWIYSGKEGSP